MRKAWPVHTLRRRWRNRRRPDRSEVNDLAEKRKLRLIRRAVLLAVALLITAIIAVPISGVALAQSPDDISLVNKDRQMVERKKEGDFVARPVFSRQVSELYYSVRHPDTGEWITNTYRVQGSGKKLSEGWEYTFEYPALDQQPDLDPEQAFLLVLGVPRQGGGERHVFHALIPVHQPKGLWDKVLGALKPDRWARAAAGWLVEGAHGTLCGVVQGIIGAGIAECDGEARGLMGDILTGTPPNLTYEHPFIRKAWTAVWAVTSGALVVILGWMGLSFIVQEHLGRHQSGWREMVPRLVLGLTAAASSLWWCALVIDVAHAVSQFIAASLEVTPGDLLRAPLDPLLVAVQAANTGLAVFIALLYIVFGFFVLYLLVQMVLRLALIDILLCLAPIGLGLWILPHTAGWGRHWLRLFMTTVFQQAVQLIAVALAFAFLDQFADITGGEAAQDLVWMLLMAIAFMYLAGRIPAMLGNHGTFDAWLHTLYFGMSLPGSMVRSGRALGLIAGGAAGGPAGVAAAAAATGAASNAAGAVNSAASNATPAAQNSPTPRSQGP